MNFEFLPIDEPFGVPRATFIGSAGRSGMDAAGDGSAPLAEGHAGGGLGFGADTVRAS